MADTKSEGSLAVVRVRGPGSSGHPSWYKCPLHSQSFPTATNRPLAPTQTMPLHRWITPKGLYTAAEKAGIAKAITDIYDKVGLPRFYVVVFFVEQEAHDFYYGDKAVTGKNGVNFVRIDVDHIARTFGADSAAQKKDFMNRYEAAISPWIKGRGLDWEVQVKDNSERDLWHENGVPAPPVESVEEAIWKRENRVVVGAELEALKAAM
ncbi:Tautomerase-3 domain-containing protein [Mycena chlorophos]|uniref:Tautomerase-3 domain-containing protein n=1 Tax=Mycena chlorophos TaxID=658473 RepID=A0A8H6W3L6_MYCCL|nr:Tautomerase-3 domain-containing protein [Mycena chlorophos]